MTTLSTSAYALYDHTNDLEYNDTSKQKKEKKELNISNSPFYIFQLMLIFISVYFNSETLKISNLISKSSYNEPTIGLYVYDLLFSILIALPLIKMTKIMGKKFNSYVYFLLCNIGGLGFALLGEVPFLRNIVIVKDFWKHLTPAAIATIAFFASIIIGVAIREIISACRYKTLTRQLFNMFVL